MHNNRRTHATAQTQAASSTTPTFYLLTNKIRWENWFEAASVAHFHLFPFSISIPCVKLFPIPMIVSRQVWPTEWCEPRMGAPSFGWVRPSICARRQSCYGLSQITQWEHLIRSRVSPDKGWHKSQKSGSNRCRFTALQRVLTIGDKNIPPVASNRFQIAYLTLKNDNSTHTSSFIPTWRKRSQISLLSTPGLPGGHCRIHLGKSI